MTVNKSNKGITMTHESELHLDWQSRLDYLLSRANVHLADLHRTKEFIIERGYKFIGLYNFFLVAVSTFAIPFIWVKVTGILVFLVVIWLLSPLLSPSSNMTQGISAKRVEVDKLSKPTESQWYLNANSFFVNKETQTTRYYGWLFHSLQLQESDVLSQIENFAKVYNRALLATRIGTILIAVVWGICYLQTLS